jgi:glycerol-3-phosphate acyltransferase PlsY
VLPLAVYLLEHPAPEILGVAALIAAGVIFLHRRNIERLLKGTENRFGRRRSASAPRS